MKTFINPMTPREERAREAAVELLTRYFGQTFSGQSEASGWLKRNIQAAILKAESDAAEDASTLVACANCKLGHRPKYMRRDLCLDCLSDAFEACQSVLRLDYFQEHNALAAQVRAALAKATTGRKEGE